MFKTTDMEDAMCIWEALLEDREFCRSTGEDSAYLDKRLVIGAAEMRRLVVTTLLKPIQAGWAEVKDDFPDSFDLDFVPFFLDEAQDFSHRQTKIGL